MRRVRVKQMLNDWWKELDNDDRSFTLFLVGMATVLFVLPMICGTIIILAQMIFGGISNATGN